MPDTIPPRIARFGEYEVDLPARQLRKRGVKLRLREQPVEVLAVLLERAGEVVSREDLRRRLWPEHVFVDFDNNLNSAIARLREALNDSAQRPRFIETVPRRGYRFIGSISAPAARRSRLLVLPFVNLSGDPAQEYFSDAVTEEVITLLARVAPEHLAVIARTTAMYYKSGHKDIGRIGRELGLDYVVEGSVRWSDDRIAASGRLIQAGDQTHLWANQYEAELREVFTVESAIVQEIAEQLGLTVPSEARKPTEDFGAYNLYIQGRYHLARTNPPAGFMKAKKHYEEAVARDPNFALAYDSLGEIYWQMGFWGFTPPKEALATGLFHVLRALEIDNTLAETHALLAQYRKQLDFDWAEVRREMNLALKLDPASPVVRLRYAITGLLPHGRLDEAIAEVERVLEVDPLFPFARCWLAEMLCLARQYDRGIEQVRMALGASPAYFVGHFVMGNLAAGKGMTAEAVAAHRRASELTGGSPLMLGWLGLSLAQSGNTDEARAVYARLQAMAPKVYVSPTSFAWIHLGLGETDSFFACMDRAVDARDHMLMPIKSYHFLDPIRSDPRYARLLRRMNLKP